MTNAHYRPRVAVFADGALCLPLVSYLAREQRLAGVVLPVAGQRSTGSADIPRLRQELHRRNIPCATHTAKSPLAVLTTLDEWQASIGIIANFPHLLSTSVLAYFASSIYAIHASPLPAYRGPDPLYWQIRNREPSTSVVLHRASAEANGGEVILERTLTIHPLDTLSSLANQVAWQAAALTEELLQQPTQIPALSDSQPKPVWAEAGPPGKSFARYPADADITIDWQSIDAQTISAMCRAGAGTPCAACFNINGIPLVLLQATPVDQPLYGTKPGTVLFIGDPEGLIVSTLDGALRLDIISCGDGIFSGLAFAERFALDAGMQF